MTLQTLATSIDSLSVIEEYSADGDPYLPKYGITLFFQYKDEAEAFLKEASAAIA